MSTAAAIPANRTRAAEQARLAVVLVTVALSVAWVLVVAWHPSDGRTAARLAEVSLSLLSGYAALRRDRVLAHLLCYGLAFGLTELVADALCVRFTRTLDYAPAQSTLLGESPWWMPLAWMVVATQIGILGAWLVERVGVWRGACLASLLGAINIPFYEEMAFYAHWWQYRNCRLWGHTPLYVIAAEAIIGGALALTARHALNATDTWRAFVLGALGGLSTIAGGIIGYGLVEKIPLWVLGI